MNFESTGFFLKAGNIPVLPYLGFFDFAPFEIGGNSSKSDPYLVDVTACVPINGLVDV